MPSISTPKAPWNAAARAASDYAGDGGGHILIFMPGAHHIRKTVESLQQRLSTSEFDIRPLHGNLPQQEQDAVFEFGSKRKVIVATNIAETSLTIDGVTLVIDSGLARKSVFDPHRGINTLLIEKISRASADQRAGRAGRTAPGLCVRLWKESDQKSRPAYDEPEIRRIDLCETILQLTALGHAADSFNWLDPPTPESLHHANSTLHALHAMEESGLSEIGRRLLSFPVHPRFGAMFIAAEYYGCLPSACLSAALPTGAQSASANPR